MGKYPNVFCFNCGSNRKMVYDKVLSKKEPNGIDIRTYWCMACNIIIVIKTAQVHDQVSSARAFIFKNREPVQEK